MAGVGKCIHPSRHLATASLLSLAYSTFGSCIAFAAEHSPRAAFSPTPDPPLQSLTVLTISGSGQQAVGSGRSSLH